MAEGVQRERTSLEERNFNFIEFVSSQMEMHKQAPVFVGLDISKSRTAMVALMGDKIIFRAEFGTAVDRGLKKKSRAQFLDLFRIWLGASVDQLAYVATKPQKVWVLEGYSFASIGRAKTILAEIGGVARMLLKQWCVGLMSEIPPTCVKAYVSNGSGRIIGKKPIIKAAQDRWGMGLIMTSDDADAAMLAGFMADCWQVGQDHTADGHHSYVLRYMTKYGIDSSIL